MSKISIKNLTKTYKKNVEAVRNINFDIEDKDFCIIGTIRMWKINNS